MAIEMQISKELHALLRSLPSAPPEIGGLIGQSTDSGMIDTAVIDHGQFIFRDICRYTPNVAALNHVICDWNHHGIVLRGIFHTHKAGHGCQLLSSTDINYILKIMEGGPSELYFPVIIPGDGIYPYLAKYNRISGLSIFAEKLEI